LESVAIESIEVTGGGGGFVDVAGTQVQISMVQLELMKLLMKRMERDRARPAAVRGYLHSSEILAEVSWDTAHPSDNHVKQLVRRLRRSLARSGRDNLVESQQGLGYRLSVRPTSTTG
jgi:DNA-binding response OmpR family regulator